MRIRKVLSVIGIVMLFVFLFVCMEYSMYSLLRRNSNFMVIPLAMLLGISLLAKDIFYKLKLVHHKWVSEILVWGSVFGGLGVLKLLLL